MADYESIEPSAADDYDESFTRDEVMADQTAANEVQEDEDEDEDYDPSSFTIDESAGDAQSTELLQADQSDTTPAQIPPIPPPQPKTLGGFIVDDDDEEEDELANILPLPSQLNGAEGAQSGLGVVAVAEAAAQDVPIASEPPDTTAVLHAQTDHVNGSMPDISLPDVSASVPSITASAPAPSIQSPVSEQGKQNISLSATSPIQNATAASQPPSAITALAPQPQTNGSFPTTPTTQRLPHDKVGQLEDRIKDDPKGDTEAWRSLIAHYREKDQLDNARKVYSRFLEVFPSAVRTILSLSVSSQAS